MTESTTAPDAGRLRDNRALVTRFVDAANAQDYGAFDGLVDPAFVDHDPIPGQPPGVAGLAMSYQVFASSFPDIRFTLEDLVAEDDLVVARGVIEGTNRGPFMGIPPTDRSMRWTATRMFRVTEGRISEGWLNVDMVGLLVQMGVIPPPSA